MFAIAFDMVVADLREHHPKGISNAYTDIASARDVRGFRVENWSDFTLSVKRER
jgi:virulence-associated protein VapD